MRATRLFGGDRRSGTYSLNPSDFPSAFQNNRGSGGRPFEPKGAWRVGFPAAAPLAIPPAEPKEQESGEMGDLIAAVRDSFRISPEVASIMENGLRLLPLEEVAERPYSPHTPTYDDGSPYDPVAEAAAEAARAAAAAKKDEL